MCTGHNKKGKSKPYLTCKVQTVDHSNKLWRFSCIASTKCWDRSGSPPKECTPLASERRQLCFAECSVPSLSKALSPTSAVRISNSLSKCLGELTAAMPSSKALLALGHDGRGQVYQFVQVATGSVGQSSLEHCFQPRLSHPLDTEYPRTSHIPLKFCYFCVTRAAVVWTTTDSCDPWTIHEKLSNLVWEDLGWDLHGANKQGNIYFSS